MGEPILLFYADHDDPGPPTAYRQARKAAKRTAKRLLNRPTVTGFEMSTDLLVRALRGAGRDVAVNDYAAARANPQRPVALTGYPRLLGWWDLPNPAIVGPGMLDHPNINPTLMDDPRFRYYVVHCDWMLDLFTKAYGPKVVTWYAGMDTSVWVDGRHSPKTVDCLIYDKIRWDRDTLVPKLLEPIQAELAARGLTTTVLRYRQHDLKTYQEQLRKARFMLFMCEHETQGIAYQEAMASNLPVLAWDPGFWVDPNRLTYTDEPVPACSVPYFGPDCGETFADLDTFHPALGRFLDRLGTYEPRAFVERELSFAGSARIYSGLYDSLVQA